MIFYRYVGLLEAVFIITIAWFESIIWYQWVLGSRHQMLHLWNRFIYKHFPPHMERHVSELYQTTWSTCNRFGGLGANYKYRNTAPRYIKVDYLRMCLVMSSRTPKNQLAKHRCDMQLLIWRTRSREIRQWKKLLHMRYNHNTARANTNICYNICCLECELSLYRYHGVWLVMCICCFHFN